MESVPTVAGSGSFIYIRSTLLPLAYAPIKILCIINRFYSFWHEEERSPYSACTIVRNTTLKYHALIH